jgi:DNA polymerase I
MAKTSAKPAAAAASPASRSLKKGDHVFLIDGSSYIFRAYFAMFAAAQKSGKKLTRSDGLPIGGVLAFSNMLFKLLREGFGGVKPTHVAVVFDHSEKTFRNEIYPDYKGHRPDPPDELIPQFPLMREAVRAFGLIPIEQPGYEADDIIATYARHAVEAGADATIVAGDKDLMQLVRPGVHMFDPMPGRERPIGRDEVIEKFGVPPEKVPEVQALIGDSTDNVPGVPGIGVKTAALLINEYGDLETLLARASEIKQEKRRQALIEHAETARMSKKLVLLDDRVQVDQAIGGLCLEGASCLEGIDPQRLVAFSKAMEFTDLTRRASAFLNIDPNTVAPDPRIAAKGIGAPDLEIVERTPDAPERVSDGPARTGELFPETLPKRAPGNDNFARDPNDLVTQRRAEIASAEIEHARYRTISQLGDLEDWIAHARHEGVLAFDLRTTSDDPMQADICGVSMAVRSNEACYLPLGHRSADDLLAGGGLVGGQVPAANALALLKPLLEDPGVLKIGHDLKSDAVVLARHGVTLQSFEDVMLMSYVLDAGLGGHGIDELATRHLDHAPIAFQNVAGKGRTAIAFERVEIARAATYCAESVDLILRLWRLFSARLVADRMSTVYASLERPLLPVLGRMERRGIMIDPHLLRRLSSDFAQTTARLEDEIAELAGERINLGSPKQLGDILFGKMGLPGASKTPTGAWSTRANVLEELAEEQGVEIARKILDWRQVSKLKSTYTDALPTYMNQETKRVHTSYALAATTTGRLSSSEPNLQNIPIRTEEGRKIRRAFIAAPGYKLVSADYSQIELRLLAEIANVPALRAAFQEGTDIHAMTASEMFGVPVQGMPGEVRRRAKAINFGIIYGISAFGLANQLGIPREEAGAYIKKYFERFPGIRDYMEESKAFCRAHGYVATLFGRKMHYPEIKAKNPSLRAFNERAAINARLQGSAADIIRRAMVRMEDALAEKKLGAQMLLQVHDELVFEVPEDEVEKTLPVVKRVMEDAPHPAVSLTVPLAVDAHAADNWEEAH